MALPVNGSTHLIPAYYSIYRPRKDERLSWPGWLTYSGWLTHISGHPSAAGRAQDRESSPARDRRSTTVPRHQPQRYCIQKKTVGLWKKAIQHNCRQANWYMGLALANSESTASSRWQRSDALVSATSDGQLMGQTQVGVHGVSY